MTKDDIIRRENAIETVKDTMKRLVDDEPRGDSDTLTEYCAKLAKLTRINEEILKALSALPSAEAEWIPVSERLPKTGDSVLVTYSDGEVSIVLGARPKAWVKYIESNNLIYPIAWMPLPKPYREDGEA